MNKLKQFWSRNRPDIYVVYAPNPPYEGYVIGKNIVWVDYIGGRFYSSMFWETKWENGSIMSDGYRDVRLLYECNDQE
jgi:hypothetical protein